MTDPHAPRTGQAPDKLPRDAFKVRFMQVFQDPAFAPEAEALARIEAVAWDAYQDGRKAPVTRRAGPGYADPDYELSVDWLEARARIDAAQAAWGRPETRSRVLLINGSPRNDGTCPGEMAKSWRLLQLAREVLEGQGIECDVLDLSLVTSDYDRHIHPCKGCASTAMPLCHWPCSCYPNHSLRQTGDWMNEIYERWVAAHGVMIFTPTHWYQAPTPLKAMIDRLVCADGGNPDPTTTHGKKAVEAKALELDGEGWHYPKHLDGRVYGVVVHGDVAGIESLRRNLCDWLDWIGLQDAGTQAKLDRYIGYYEPYATSHETLDEDEAMQEEARNAARAVAMAVGMLRAGRLTPPDARLRRPRPK
ncbi:flavodoxin family protein [Pseudacidovorax intermedius]|uniref:NADPH-dependent FMN reductase n=1 Tax=Pseudacidovorax intermedius TaxID=433924 RepID=A0A147GR16_9BURK|nr:flavodoxin family protein [Pseudacidovorax intermedius]KTT18758.1 NADPH-dependent FMN reductase [Pseudacidovorax intermedius]